MNSSLISIELLVGTTAFAPAILESTLTIDRIREEVNKHFEDYTVIPAGGAFRNRPEDSAIVKLFFVGDDSTLPSEVYRFCQRVHDVIESLLRELGQRSIVAFISVSAAAREIRWSRAVSYGPPLINPPFLFPCLLVRNVASKMDDMLVELLRMASEHAQNIAKNNRNSQFFGGVPGIWFRTDEYEEYDLSAIAKNAYREKWDKSILVLDERPFHAAPEFAARCEANSDAISPFQVVSNRPVYYASSLADVRSQNKPGPIEVRSERYYLAAGCCEGSYLEAFDACLALDAQNKSSEDMKHYFQSKCSLGSLDRTPFPIVGISVATRTPAGKLLIKRRGNRVGAYPGLKHIAPSGVVEPIPGCDYPSILGTFLRELDEEMFGGPDSEEHLQTLLSKDHIAELKGKLTYLGNGIDLLRRDVNILLLFEPDTSWWQKFQGRIKLNWEYSTGAADYKRLKEILDEAKQYPRRFVPAALATLHFFDKRNAKNR